MSVEADDGYSYNQQCNCPEHQQQRRKDQPDGPLEDLFGENNNIYGNNDEKKENNTNLRISAHHCDCQSLSLQTPNSDQLKANHLAVLSGNRRPVRLVKDANDNSLVDSDDGGGGDSDLDLADHLNRNFVRNRRYTENMIRMQAMAMSDDEDFGE